MIKKMAHDKTCKQAYSIRKVTGYPSYNMRQYSNKIVIFFTTSIADAQDTHYIVDKKGELVELT